MWAYVVVLIFSSVCDVISNCIKEALVRSQPMNQERFNFQVGVFQLIIGVILLAVIKVAYLSQSGRESSPFGSPEVQDMNVFSFAALYVKLSYQCIFYTKGQGDYDSIDEYNKYQNEGECNHAIWYIVGYTMSIFIVQYNIGSIMHHRFIRYVQYLYAIMVPITFLAFLAAIPVVRNGHVKNDFTNFDVAGLAMVATGVFLYNFIREKPQ